MVIGIDIDGVLANFEAGFAPILTSVSGIKFPRLNQPGWPDSWDWDLEAGITPKQQSAAWTKLKASPTFWLDLPTHPGAIPFLQWLSNRSDDLYFITSRPGIAAKWQTERWLKRHGFFGAPTVLISGQKGLAAQALQLSHYIDDKWENCLDVIERSPSTKVYMKICPYNRKGILPCAEGNLDGFRRFIEGVK